MASASLPKLANADARKLFLASHGLLERPVGQATRAEIADQITALGFVQVDSINTVARAHDHILWSRMPGYRQGRAMGCAAKTRHVFEGWTHDAALIPSQFHPHWRHKFDLDRSAIADRWQRWGREGFHEEFDAILKRIGEEGALSSAELGDGERQNGGGWWDWKPTKTALEYLWRTGELSICHRRGFSKVYDLAERVIPPEHLNARVSQEESIDWSARAALERLGFGTASELSAFWDIFSKKTLADWQKAGPEGVTEIEVQGADGSWKTTLAPEDWEAQFDALPGPSERLRILSPFDPALRDRKRIERLFGYDYRIEVFVPEAKRRYGYYVFPILEGLRLTGRIDLKAERAKNTLLVQGYWPERGVKLGSGRAKRLADEITRIARLAEVERIEVLDRPQTEILRERSGFMARL
ncbi:MAG: crosslink repair DNA glycosylase YcaQ family protein [Pseudomonadota bacterium]